MRSAVFTVAVSILCSGWCDSLQARIDCMHRRGDALPTDAYSVSAAQAGELQRLLDTHDRVRLDPGGDYRRATGVTIHSGQALFGAAGTRMGRLIVAPGTSRAIVSGVIPEALEFPPSRLVTHDNCFERFAARATAQSPLTLRNTMVENNLFLDAGQIVIDTTSGGRVRNNRFIRTVVHGNAPALQLRGRVGASEDRNVFLWINILSAVGDGVILQDQSQLNFIGLDAEDWNSHGTAANPAMLSAQRVEALHLFMPQGGDNKVRPDPFMDLAADNVELIAPLLYRSAEPAIRLRSAVRRFDSLLLPSSRVREEAADGAGWKVFPDGADSVQLREPTTMQSSPESGAPATPWEPPEFGAIPDPAGPDWRTRRRSAPDSTRQLQQMIDEQGIAQLPAGEFLISAPLRLKRGQGLIGAGMGRTVIVARTDDLDMIVGDDHLTRPQPTSLVLVDLTLQGGRVGLRHDAKGSGGGAQYVYTQLSHVAFRDLTEAGIRIDGIYGWDNNLLDELTFYRVPIGIEQRPNPQYISAAVSGNVAGTNYLDKNVCYRCRFEDVQTGLSLLAKRANNLNACVNCLFAHNRDGAIKLQYSNSTLVANSDFIDNGGDPIIQSDLPVGIVGSRFAATRPGSVLDMNAICEACEFTGSAAVGASIARTGARVVLLNSRASGMTLGRGVTAFLDESVVPRVTATRTLRVTKDGEVVLRVGDPHPTARLLIDWMN